LEKIVAKSGGSQVKKSLRIRASHVNSGTSKEWSSQGYASKGFKHPKLQVDVVRSESSPYGGLLLASELVRKLKLPQRLRSSLNLLRKRRAYSESEHVLTHVFNLYLGGSCIEDISLLQSDETVRRMLGAKQIPDPTTAGDFLRRFDKENLDALNTVIDDTHQQVWKMRYGRKKRAQVLVDLDSHIRPIYGNQKEAADFNYKGSYGYHPLVISLAQSQEVLRVLNRPGNVASADGAGALLDEVFPLLNRNFKHVIVRGDSAFAKQELYELCEEYEQSFAFVLASYPNLVKLAEIIPKNDWQLFEQKASRGKTQRKRGKNIRRKQVHKHKKRNLELKKQWFAEIPYTPAKSEQEYRLVVRRQKIEESRQGELFTFYRYRFAITNLPQSYSAREVLKLVYQRCDQENVIEQLKNGVSAMKMPVAAFAAISAYLCCARMAHNFKAWLAMLALPEEIMRWEWKRFRLAFVYLSAQVIHKARQTLVRIADSHRFAHQVQSAILRMQV
jgi:hypothetical protein